MNEIQHDKNVYIIPNYSLQGMENGQDQVAVKQQKQMTNRRQSLKANRHSRQEQELVHFYN